MCNNEGPFFFQCPVCIVVSVLGCLNFWFKFVLDFWFKFGLSVWERPCPIGSGPV